MSQDDDVTSQAALAIQSALTEADRQRLLGKFHHTGLDGADVADILDILDNGDALLDLREPFYEDGGFQEALVGLGWTDTREDYAGRLRLRLVGFAVLAVALLTDAVPTAGSVSRLAARAETLARS